MRYGKQWKVSKSTLETLILNADESDDCFIEVWNPNSNVIEDTSTKLWLKLASGWYDDFPVNPPAIDPTV
ncbi:hypothetical protein K9N50_06420 [bacterium]|nr:hypothetical protein [bacterium]